MAKSMTSRRKFMTNGLVLGCSAAASPLITPVTFARVPGEARLVVIILRGAMDGLDVLQPYGDRDLMTHRKLLSLGPDKGASDLDGFFALHQGLADLVPLWQSGELAFAHAVSTPYRDKRSHFDGQDFLENGGASANGDLTTSADGWLNRMLALTPGARAETAFAVGRENMRLLSGRAPHLSWSPDSDLDLTPQAQLLLRVVYEEDPLFHEAGETAIQLAEETDAPNGMGPGRARRAAPLARFAAGRLRGDTRIAAFSINGWDTHANQEGGLRRALGELQTAILTLKDGLGPVWDQTAVVCLTEFGRTVRENGARGTDHGTGGAAVFAGGALRGGRVHTNWPGLKSRDLYRDRDLMPTRDVRAYAAWAIRDLFGFDKTALTARVFPGLDMGPDPRLIA